MRQLSSVLCSYEFRIQTINPRDAMRSRLLAWIDGVPPEPPVIQLVVQRIVHILFFFSLDCTIPHIIPSSTYHRDTPSLQTKFSTCLDQISRSICSRLSRTTSVYIQTLLRTIPLSSIKLLQASSNLWESKIAIEAMKYLECLRSPITRQLPQCRS